MQAQDLLRCPHCHASGLAEAASGLRCGQCGTAYEASAETGFARLLAPGAINDGKANIQKWWGDLYAQLYKATDDSLTTATLAGMVDQFEDLMRQRRHMVAVEMPLAELAGQRVLEIGPGGGGHSCLFKKYGARVVAADITPERAMSTARKLSLMPGPESLGVNADGENLPFDDDSFDIVYSNGVLHHAENTDRCLDEVFRVLKPGGRAVIMLYSRHSSVFWLNIVPRALFSGEMFRWPEPQWIGRVTEGKPKFGETKNPFTRVYSAAEIRRAFARFAVLSLRKSSFQFDNVAIPRLTQLRNAVLPLFGQPPHPGGVLVYGTPCVPETRLELALGPWMGFSWNVVAQKPR